jgi:hypothetical protein
MNGTGDNRYSANWEKRSKKLRMLYPCAVCGENDYDKKEVHHFDNDKKNSNIENLIVLCKKCHLNYHKGLLSLPEDINYKHKSGYGVTVAHFTSSEKDWFDSRKPLYLLPDLPPAIANKFRKIYLKGFVVIGACNYYIGLSFDNKLIGVLGFYVPDYVDYSLLLKADTTPSNLEYSTDLLLYMLRTKEVKNLLEKKFNRNIDTVYSMCFSRNKSISRYRKHGKKVQEKQVEGGYNLGYIFQMGSIASKKAAISEWRQKHKL